MIDAAGDGVNDATTTVTLGAGNEILTGSAGQDTVNMTGGGTDNVNLGAGVDNLNDAENIAGTDIVVGGTGNDVLTFSYANVNIANLAGTSGFDLIRLEDDGVDNAITVVLNDACRCFRFDSVTITGVAAMMSSPLPQLLMRTTPLFLVITAHLSPLLVIPERLSM